jgi:putative transposase
MKVQKAYRAILIELPKDSCDVDHIKRLMTLSNLAYRDYEVWTPDLPRTIQHHLYGSFKNYMGSLVFGTEPKRWFVETWVPLKVLRVYQDGSMKGDKSAPVVLELRDNVDFKRNVIRLRQVCKNEPGYIIELTMPKWVIERIREGGDIKYAMIGLRDDEPYLALVAERVVEPFVPSDYRLIVDINSWSHGIAWGLIRDGRIVSFKQEGLNPQRVVSLYNQAVKRERKVGRLKRLGLGNETNVKRAGRMARRLRSRIYRLINEEAMFMAGKLVRKALKYKAMVVIDDVDWESLRELLTRKYGGRVGKLLLSGLKRFVHQLETLAKWYGVPYKFERLYSKRCPRCEHELAQLPGRIMVCENCGFKAPRDLVPMYWAIKVVHPGDRKKLNRTINVLNTETPETDDMSGGKYEGLAPRAGHT